MIRRVYRPFPHPHHPRRGHPDINHVISPFFSFTVMHQVHRSVAIVETNVFQQEWRKTMVFFSSYGRFSFLLAVSRPLQSIDDILSIAMTRNGQSIDNGRISSPISRIPYSNFQAKLFARVYSNFKSSTRRPARLSEPSQP